MSDNGINRRRLLVAGALTGAAGAAGAVTLHDGERGADPRTYSGTMPWRGGAADAPPIAEGGTGYTFFNALEQAFLEPALDRLIPPDPAGPSATQANVHIFIDRQLAGPYGRGDHYFLGGPWPKGVAEQGYQSRLSPAQVYRLTIPAIEGYVRGAYNGKLFKDLAVEDQDKVLKSLESGDAKLDSADGKMFFTMFLQNAMEGYFSDPIYGGNKDMGAWKMIGFPGAHYDYREWVGRHNERVPYPPVSIKGRPGWSET